MVCAAITLRVVHSGYRQPCSPDMAAWRTKNFSSFSVESAVSCGSPRLGEFIFRGSARMKSRPERSVPGIGSMHMPIMANDIHPPTEPAAKSAGRLDPRMHARNSHIDEEAYDSAWRGTSPTGRSIPDETGGHFCKKPISDKST